MILDNRSLNDISFDDIRALVEERVPEGLTLDYKRTAYDFNKRFEMLRDISAFANAEGGYLILGIDEDGNDHPTSLVPIDNPSLVVDQMRKLCLDGISERIEGLEFRIYDMGFNQGIIVAHVPPSRRRPHMVAFENRNEFSRRYENMKRNMTVAEIRDAILLNPLFQRPAMSRTASAEMVGTSEGVVAGGVTPEASPVIQSSTQYEAEPASYEQKEIVTYTSQTEGPSPVQVLTQRPVERFLYRYLVGGTVAQVLVLLSPFISILEGSNYKLESIIDKVNTDRTRLYVITQRPHEVYQLESIKMLESCRYAEIRYNPNVHAKLYICWSRDETESFGLFGSGNLTEGGLHYNIELGMMISARGYGRSLLRELYQWSSNTVRTASERSKAIIP